MKAAGMEKLTILDNEWVVLWYYPDTKIVHHRIKKFISGDRFKEFLLAVTALITKHRAEKWLADDRESPVLRLQDIEWADLHWFPQTALAGWKYWAFVQPNKAVGKVMLRDVAIKFAKYGVTCQSFVDPDEALSWLKSQ